MTVNGLLPTDTHWESVALTVADLGRSMDFYTQRLGLAVRERGNGSAVLGSESSSFLKLVEQPGSRPARGTTGLFHFAILVPSRESLAASLRQLVSTRTPLQGASDHLVSEAIYLADPDGNGIEVYRDRPRDAWRHENGEVVMATEPLDLQALLAETRDGWTGISAAMVLGHMHLHVARIPAAEQFYREIVGFDLTTRYGPSASFMSAGGYHHHLAVNTWAGLDAPRPPSDAAGLRESTLVVPEAEAIEGMAARAGAAGVSIDRSGRGLMLRDPSGNAIRIVAG